MLVENSVVDGHVEAAAVGGEETVEAGFGPALVEAKGRSAQQQVVEVHDRFVSQDYLQGLGVVGVGRGFAADGAIG